MKNKLLLILISFVSFAQAQDQKQSYSLSLQQAIEHALQNNYSAINADRDIEAAKKKKWETTTIGLPQITGSASYLYNIDFTQQGVSGNAFNPAGNPDDIALFAFGTKNSMNSNLTLSQLIFDGSYLVGLQSAKTYLKISENAKVKTNQELREIVISTYGNVLLAKESVAILEKNKTVLTKTVNDTKEIYKNGFTEEENVEQLQLTLASLESSLSYSKRMETIATNMLKLVLGIELENDLKLTDNLDTLTQKNLDLAILQEQFNVTNNIDYQIGENSQEASRLMVLYEKSKALPSLGAALNFGYNSFSNDFTFFNSDQKWNRFSNVGVSLNVPIFSSFGRTAKTQQAKIAFEQSKTQLKETEQKLKLQFQEARSNYEYSLEQYATAKNSLSLAERIEGKQQIKFREGLSSSFDFTEAQQQLYSRQQDYLKSMVEVVNKKATLDKLLNKN
ncbi:TolC family protein [Flavobacterium capsici]|uniref:TolC family protein n=1 Tax=Flavobacterium capsici TaxID=3075618 RepID=A0AA96EX92_9FLAO|nr:MULTISPECIES: TolC family protein [unclassified Flavobacterium]WNM19851.1 TolC family protein [Flavobacterium sp. PMR2A8]WNM21240.1 TolC family protein [Flavobacterium sp. PMTSA4]